MSFKFAVGQEVVRVDSVTGKPWGLPVTILHRNILVLPAHKIFCEKRYAFKEGGYCYEFPENALASFCKICSKPILDKEESCRPYENKVETHLECYRNLFPERLRLLSKPADIFIKTSWWSWLFHD